jgi:nucleoid-associated protein YgaU
MFTVMAHRPLVWLLAALALAGVGWVAYGPVRQALQPATGTAERSPEAAPAAVSETPAGPPPPAPAGDEAKAVAEAPAPAPPPAASAPEATTATPVEPAPADSSQLAGTPAEPPVAATPEAPAVAAPRAAEAAPNAATAPRRSELAPAAGPPAPPAAPVTPPEGPAVAASSEATPEGTAVAASSEAAPEGTTVAASSEAAPEGTTVAASSEAAHVAPEATAPAVVERAEEPPATASVTSAASPEARQSPPAPAAGQPAAPEVAKVTPLPSTAPASPETSAEAAEPPPPSLSLNTIRRALAALLGGAPEPTDLAARPVEKPEPKPEAVKPDQARDLAKAAEPAAGPPAIVRPSFDIVRVEPGGRAVVAGRAAPGAEVELLAGDRVLDRVRADRRGEWVATPSEPLAPGGLELSLRATSEGAPAVKAEQVVVVVVPEPPPPQPAPVEVAEGPPPQPPPVAGAEAPPPQPAEVRLAEAPAGPLAVLLPGDGRAPGRILQAPGRISSDGRLALLVLDYDDSGRTRLTGEAPPGAPLRIYVDNKPAAEAVTEPSGKWTAVLEHDLAPGEYTLRLDQIGGQGRPVARLETPFTRVSQPPIQGKTEVDYVIVQPGNSLWRIAHRLFGSGMSYVQIYDANQAQIRDPDLIYPGQVFEIPAGIGSAG